MAWFSTSKQNSDKETGKLVLYLFPDTNFFLQCYPPEQIDWAHLGDFDEVSLVVTRPVQKEIDQQKNRGNDRLGKRSRKVHSILKSIRTLPNKELVARDANPKVTLVQKIHLKPAEAPDPRLTMTEPDDQLVAIALAFRDSEIGGSVRLLSDDGGPIASADMLELEYEPILAQWKLPIESNKDEKDHQRLLSELDRYKRQEPAFDISFLHHDKLVGSHLALKTVCYLELGQTEIDRIVDILTAAFPEGDDFGNKTTKKRAGMRGIGEEWQPVSQQQIEEYKAKRQSWVESVRESLRKLNTWLNEDLERPIVTLRAKNVGARPGRDTLVEVQATGGFYLTVPDSAKSKGENTFESLLEDVPRAPQGRWRSEFELSSDALFAAKSLDYQFKSILGNVGSSHFQENPSHLLPLSSLPTSKKPNSFYSKSHGLFALGDAVRWECQQWRHSKPEEDFLIQVLVPKGPGKFYGQIMAEIHAENLTEVAAQSISVQVDQIQRSCVDVAKDMIEKNRKHHCQ